MPYSIPEGIEEVLTPSRKRRREKEDLRLQSRHNGLSNEGFSSTPRRAAQLTNALQNGGIVGINPFISTSTATCMEVKSIAEIASEKVNVENPYEVIRKPPKKRKKQDIEDVCFENPALNLDGPEKRFNPFEVQRQPIQTSNDNCFVNTALNIKSPENAAVNPYEITRSIAPSSETIKEGIENPALEEPTPVTLTIPFTPTIGCRIDFTGVSLDNLTPSKLLAEKLVFSPPTGIRGSAFKKSFRRSLSVISEETVDIGRELDCYQLELENSINEAKLKKKTPMIESNSPDKPEGAKCCSDFQEINNQSSVSINVTNINISIEAKSPGSEMTPPIVNMPSTIDEISDADITFDDEMDFKEPAPFVRCYRKADLPRTQSAEIEQISNSSKSSNKSDTGSEHKHKIANMIRKSIRKIVRPHFGENKKDEKEDKNDIEHESSGTNNFISTLRRSLRRKPHKNESNNNEVELNPIEGKAIRDISIIDTSEKRMIFRFAADNEKNIPIENGAVVTDTKPLSLRKSLRRSTRGFRNHVLKKVFHKNIEEYKMKD